jgi:hypothetical protein
MSAVEIRVGSNWDIDDKSHGHEALNRSDKVKAGVGDSLLNAATWDTMQARNVVKLQLILHFEKNALVSFSVSLP